MRIPADPAVIRLSHAAAGDVFEQNSLQSRAWVLLRTNGELHCGLHCRFPKLLKPVSLTQHAVAIATRQ